MVPSGLVLGFCPAAKSERETTARFVSCNPECVYTLMDVARNEIIGPFAPVLGFGTVDEMIALAYGTDDGFAFCVHAPDLGRVWWCSDAPGHGVAGVSEVADSDEATPFGSMMESSFGHESANWHRLPLDGRYCTTGWSAFC